MKEKQFEPAKNNESAPEKGIASVNTHNPGEEPVEDLVANENSVKKNPSDKDESERDQNGT